MNYSVPPEILYKLVMYAFKHSEISAIEGSRLLDLDAIEFKEHFIIFIQQEGSKQTKPILRQAKDKVFIV